jgi:hypothetical protein
MFTQKLTYILICCACVAFIAGVPFAQEEPGQAKKQETTMEPSRPTPPDPSARKPQIDVERRRAASRRRLSPERMQGMVERMGVTPESHKAGKKLINVPVPMDGPEALLSQKEELNLTKEQVQKLEQLAKDAREKANAVLTEEQKSKLTDVSEKPVSSLEMLEGIIKQMQTDARRPEMPYMMLGTVIISFMEEEDFQIEEPEPVKPE